MRRRFSLKQSAPLIFTSLSVVGIIGTAVLGVRGGMEAEKILAERKDIPEDFKGKTVYIVKNTWKCYVWTIMAALGSAACVIASHKLSAKQIAALSSVAAAGATTFNQYRDKVREVIGEDKERELYEEVRQKSDWTVYPQLPHGDLDDTSYLFYDGYSKRYFYSNPERIQQAIYHLNRNFQLKQEVSVNEWYEMIGIDGIEGGDDDTWVVNDFWEGGLTPWIDIYQQISVRDDTGEKCTQIFFDWDPGTAHEEWT